MPAIRSKDFVLQTGNVSSQSVPMPEHQTGDLLFVVASKDDATGTDPTTATSGWTRGGSGVSGGATTAAVRCAWFYKTAASAAEADLVITSSDADSWSIIVMAIEGAHATPIDASTGNGNTDATGAPFTATGLTTNYDKSMVLFICCSSVGTPMPYPGLQLVDAVDTGNEGTCVAYTIQHTAGVVADHNFYVDALNVNTRMFCVAIRDDGTGKEAPYWDRDYATLIHPFRGSSTIVTGDVWGTALTNYPTTGKENVVSVQMEDVGTGFTDYTTAANNATDADVLTCPATEAIGDYIAFGHTKPFMSLVIDRAGCTAGTVGVVAWEYWNGSAWIALSSVSDGTTSFTNVTLADGQVVRWQMPVNRNWKTTTLNGAGPYYYVRARVTTVYTINPTISQAYIGGHATLYDAIGAQTDSGRIQYENASSFTPALSASQIGGTYIDLGQTVNLANKIVVGSWAYALPRDYVDSARFSEGGGIHIMLADTSFNRKHWCIGSYLDKYTSKNSAYNRFAIDWEQTVDTTMGRTQTDPADTVADVFLGGLGPRGAQSFYVTHMAAIDPANAVINGGSSTTPINLTSFTQLGEASPLNLFESGLITVPVTIGGSDSVHFVLTDFVLSFPKLATPWTDPYNTDPSSTAHYDEGVLGFTLDARSGDTCKMTSGRISSESLWKFNITATASSGATWDFAGLTLAKATVTLRQVTTFSAMNFDSCPTVTQNGATITDCTFVKSRLLSGNPAVVSSCAFTTITGSGHGIEIITPGTYAFDGNLFSGFGADATTDAAVYNNSGGAVTLNIGDGGSTPTVRNGVGATTTLVVAPVTTQVTTVDATTGSVISGARVLVTAADATGPLPYQKSTTITRSGSTATATCTAHGLTTGSKALIKGANQAEYNGLHIITNTGANTFTFTVSGTPTTPATGTILTTGVLIAGKTDGVGVISDIRSLASNQNVTGRARYGTDTASPGGLGFNAIGDALKTVDLTIVPDLNYFSTTFWFKRPTGVTDSIPFEAEANGSNFIVYLNGGVLTITDGYGFATLVTGPAITVETWYFVGVVRNGTALSLYVGTEGTAVTEYTGTDVLLGTTQRILHYGTSGNLYLGAAVVSHARVWDAILSDAEIEAERTNFDPVRTAGLKAEWPLNDTVNPYVDISGNENTLVNAGSGTWTSHTGPSFPTKTKYRTAGISGTVSSTTGLSTTLQLIPDQ